MGLYDSLFPGIDLQNVRQIGLVVIGLIVLVALFFVALPLFSTPVLQTSLSGPIDLSTNPEGFPVRPNTELTITVTNPKSQPVSNVTVFVQPQDSKAILAYPTSFVIETLDKKRTLVASIRTNPTQKVLSGIYLLEVTVLLGTQEFKSQVELEVKNPES